MNTIENQREALESASANTAVLSAMGDAAKAMKKAHQLDVDDVRNSDELYQIMHEYICLRSRPVDPDVVRQCVSV